MRSGAWGVFKCCALFFPGGGWGGEGMVGEMEMGLDLDLLVG